MALDFKVRDVIHRVTVKFIHAFLPDAKKKYNLKAVFQPELDIHGIASKADVYNITTPPKVIEEGLTAGMELMYYLAADGYKIKTPLFNLRIRIPGEYDGDETHLPEGVHPEARLHVNADLRKYIRERVGVVFDGIDADDGFISEALDEATGLIDRVITPDNLLTIRGCGLKVESDEAGAGAVGVFFATPSGKPVRAKALAVNEPRTLKIITPPSLAAGTEYRLQVVTQGSPKGSGHLLKAVRTVQSDFFLKLED